MKSILSLKKIRVELASLKNYEVVLFGSFTTNYFTKRSDIDVAIITRNKDRVKNMKVWKNALKKSKSKYHVNVFELVPLHLKASIFCRYRVVFGNREDISEYFYFFRKLWKDVSPRYYEQFKTTSSNVRIVSN